MIDKAGWFYYGCIGGPGHYLWQRQNHANWRALELVAESMPPQDTTEQFVGVISRLGSFGLSALGFWDCTGDHRPGSCSVIFAPSMTCDGRSMLLGAKQHFPLAYARWSQGITVRASA